MKHEVVQDIEKARQLIESAAPDRLASISDSVASGMLKLLTLTQFANEARRSGQTLEETLGSISLMSESYGDLILQHGGYDDPLSKLILAVVLNDVVSEFNQIIIDLWKIQDQELQADHN